MPAIDVVLTSPPAWIGAAAAAHEELGVDGLVAPESSADIFVLLALAGAATTSVAIGSSVAIAFARSPMVTAYGARSVHDATGGRFRLGLGPQIAPHITRRFSMPWSAPAARMREYVEALHRIFEAWETGGRLHHEGEFYELTMMPPLFDPGPAPGGPPPIDVGAVGPRMTEVALAVADGLITHPMATHHRLADVVRPAVDACGRSVTLSSWVMVATGLDDEARAASRELVRAQIAFYGSTPAYVPLLAHHDDEAIQPELRRLTKAGAWDDLSAFVGDDLVDRYAVCGTPAEVADELRVRYGGGLVDRLQLSFFSADPLPELEAVMGHLRG